MPGEAELSRGGGEGRGRGGGGGGAGRGQGVRGLSLRPPGSAAGQRGLRNAGLQEPPHAPAPGMGDPWDATGRETPPEPSGIRQTGWRWFTQGRRYGLGLPTDPPEPPSHSLGYLLVERHEE